MRTPCSLSTLALVSMVSLAAFGGDAAGQSCDPKQTHKLLSEEEASRDWFGESVAIADGIVVVGASIDDDNGDSSGSAYVFDAVTGQQLHKLLANDGGLIDFFGCSVAVADGIVAVGADGEDDNGAYSGAAYLFDAATGQQLQKLLASDGEALDNFGDSIAIANGIVAVGADGEDENGNHSGSAYVFDAATGQQLHKLLAKDGTELDAFGVSIAIADGVVAVGADGEDDNGDRAGAAYLFDAATGEQLHKLMASDGVANDWFGSSIAIADGIVVVGAKGDDDSGDSSGSAYLFDAATGQQLHKLLPDDGQAHDDFGFCVAIANGIVAVGAPEDDDYGPYSGSAYLFDAATGQQLHKLLASDGARNDSFGLCIAVADAIVAVGAEVWDDNDSGSAYVFSIDDCNPALTIKGACPGVMVFRVSGATPGGRVAFIHARAEGVAPIPPACPCAGTRLGLDRTAILAEVIRADGSGLAALEAQVPPAACGGIYVQGLDLGACATSNTAFIK